MSSTEIAATDWEKYVLSLQKICKTTPFAMQQCVVMNSGIRYLHVSLVSTSSQGKFCQNSPSSQWGCQTAKQVGVSLSAK